VSSYDPSTQTEKAAEVARNLGIANFPCQLQTGSLRAARGRDGKVTLSYKVASKPMSVSTIAFIVVAATFAISGLCYVLAR